MNIIDKITEEELLGKVQDGVSKNVIWQKPLLLLTKDGSDYTYIMDKLGERFSKKNINTDPFNWDFIRVDGKLELSLNGVSVDGHNPDVDIYEYLGGPLGFDEKVHRYCVNLIEYEAKPVISLICVQDKNCSVENIPTWIKEQFEVVMLKYLF